MKKKIFLAVLMLAVIFAGCNLEVKNPNQLTIHLAGENTTARGICEGHNVLQDLNDNAKEIIITVRSFGLAPKTYSLQNKQIKPSKNSITINNADFGSNFDIEIQIMGSVASYIGRLHGVTIEPYEANNITIPIVEIKPHILMWGDTNIYAVPDVNNRSLVFEKSIHASGEVHGETLTTDKYGRVFYVEKPSSGTILKEVNNAVNTGSLSVDKFWIDPFTNELYAKVSSSTAIKKHPIGWTEVEEGKTTTISTDTKCMAFSKEYVVALIYKTWSYDLYVYNKKLSEIAKNKNEFVGDYTIYDMKIVNNKLYVINSLKTTIPINSIKVFTLPSLELENTIEGLQMPVKFVGQRDNLLYIADMGNAAAAAAPSPRLYIFNTSTNKLDFIDAKEFDPGINFN